MGIRLQGRFDSVKENDTYTINIHDSSYSGAVIDFDVTANGVTISYNQDDKQRNHTLLTSKAKVKILIKNSNILTFLTDVTNAAEGRFLLEILKNGNKYWYGYVLPQLFSVADRPFGAERVFTLQATDGIGRLKSIKYNNGGLSYTGKESFLDHLYNILSKIGFDSFYSVSEDYLITYVNWWDQSHTYDTATNPYELSRFDHRALISIDSGGETIYTDAYDVLEHIVKSWNARFLFSDGAYYLVQVNEYETDGATKVLRKYDKAKTLTTTSTSDLSIWEKRTGNLSKFQNPYELYHNNGRFEYYPALRQVSVQYEHYSTDNLIPGKIWNQSQSPTATFSEVDTNGGTVRLTFSTNIESRIDYTVDTQFQVLAFWFRLTFKVGNKYLKRSFSIGSDGKIKYGNFTWEDDLSYVDIFSQYTRTDNIAVYLPVSFTTPLVPENGDLTVNITRRIISYNNAGQQVDDSVDWTPYWSFYNTSVNVYTSGNVESQTNVRFYTAINDNGSTNSEVEEVQVLVGDGPSPNTFGHIEVYDGANWVDSSGWRVGNTGSYTAFGQLLANEIMAGQKVAVERYFGTLTGDFIAHARLKRINDAGTTSYVFIGGTQNLHQDTWNVELFQIDYDPADITENTAQNYIDIRPTDITPFKPGFPNFPPDFFDDETGGNPVITYDGDDDGPTQITIDGQISSGSEITTVPVEVIPSDDFLKDGDEVVIVTPTGEEIPVIVDGDVNAGDTTVDIVPVTPGVDIPEGSTIQVKETDLFAYVQRSRNQVLRFSSDIRVTDAIVDGNALFFFRVDEQSRLYLRRASKLEVQVYTPGGGGGTYDYQFKIDGTNIVSTNTAETTTIARTALDYTLVSGLYSFHISNISGTVPTGVNFWLEYVEPLQIINIIPTTSTINDTYPGDPEAFAGGVGVGKLYQMSLANYHGMPFGLVIQNYSSFGFASDALATTVATDQWYAVTAGNVYGVKIGAVRAKNYTGTTYASDSAAASGGIAVGSTYVLSTANAYGIAGGFIKVRKA